MDEREVRRIVESEITEKFKDIRYDYNFECALKEALMKVLDDSSVRRKIKEIISS